MDGKTAQLGNNLKPVGLKSTTSVANRVVFNLYDMRVLNQVEVLQPSPYIKKKTNKFYILLIRFFTRLFKWANGVGSSNIDLHRMEHRSDQQLGIRKWNL
jgi:hypothetical protein